jgi:CubicO group peptidase (beta-lactamase class C family)
MGLADWIDKPLVPLPAQPAGVPWPGGGDADWPTGPTPPAVAALVDEAFARPVELGTTFAVVAVVGGRVVAERYGGEIERWDGPNEPVGPSTPLLSWSMAKSVLHALVGIAGIELDQPPAVPEWSAASDDDRAAITLQDMLEMRDGLAWNEDYFEAGGSDVIEMLFGSGQDDVARFAAERGLAAPPGTRFNYSSGTSNIVSRAVAAGPAMSALLRDGLLGPIGVADFDTRFDRAGTWIASSFLYMPARDWARFGSLYLRDGVWDGRRVLPEGWVDHGRAARSEDPDDATLYGRHWWVVGDEWGSFRAAGYEGQMVVVSPGLDSVLVRLGKTDEDKLEPLTDWRTRMIAALA